MNFVFKSNIEDIVYIKWGVLFFFSCMFNEVEVDIVFLIIFGDLIIIQIFGLNLIYGKKYFICFYVMDLFGLKFVMCSDGILIDMIFFFVGYFQDGVGEVDVMFFLLLRCVWGKFDYFKDFESFLVRYEWKILRNNIDEDVMLFVDIVFI